MYNLEKDQLLYNIENELQWLNNPEGGEII